MSHEFKLRSGRTVRLRDLRQRGTYEGLLEGLPTSERNKRLMASLLRDEAHALYAVPAYLIAPLEQAIRLPEGESYPFGTPAALPAITCVGRFDSLSPTATGSGDASGLVVIWFQEEFQYPPPSDIVASLQLIDWDAHAGNYEY